MKIELTLTARHLAVGVVAAARTEIGFCLLASILSPDLGKHRGASGKIPLTITPQTNWERLAAARERIVQFDSSVG